LKGVEVSFDSLIGFSKLQDVLELILEQLSEHEQVIQPLQENVAELRDGRDSSLQQLQAKLDSQQASIQEVETRLKSQNASAGAMSSEQLKELVSRLDRQGELVQQLHTGGSPLHQELLARLQAQETAFEKWQGDYEDVTKKVQELHGKEEARQLAMPKPGEELPPEIRSGIACALAPLEAAIAALDAKIESQLVVRLEAHSDMLVRHEQVHKNLYEAVEGELERSRSQSPQRGWNNGPEQEEARQAAILSVKQEVSDLSKKLSEVVTCLGDLETQLFTQSLELSSGNRSEFADMLSDACKQLEGRVAMLEGRLQSGSSKDLSEMGDSLRQLQTAASRLEGLVSKDVQPKLDVHGSEMRRLGGELSGLCQRINSMVAESSSTTTSVGHCLTCHETRRQAHAKVLIGTDGKVYEQGNGWAAMNNKADNVSSTISWDDHGGSLSIREQGILNAYNRPKSGNGLARQGGSGAPLRKYRIPVGPDGNPTWGSVKGNLGQPGGSLSASTPTLPAAFERGRGGMGLPRPTSAVGLGAKQGQWTPSTTPPSRPASAISPGSPGSNLHPLLGSLKLLGAGSEDTSG